MCNMPSTWKDKWDNTIENHLPEISSIQNKYSNWMELYISHNLL
jgi:hypothetical protein